MKPEISFFFCGVEKEFLSKIKSAIKNFGGNNPIHFFLLKINQFLNFQLPYKIPRRFSTTACGCDIFSENSGIP